MKCIPWQAGGLFVYHFLFCGRLIFFFFFFERERFKLLSLFRETDTLTRLVMVVAAAREVIKKSNLSLFPKTPVPNWMGSNGLGSRQSFDRTFI